MADTEVQAPEPEEIFERTRKEGARRLERPVVEVMSTVTLNCQA